MDLDFDCCEVKKALSRYFMPNKVLNVEPFIASNALSIPQNNRTAYYAVIDGHKTLQPQIFTHLTGVEFINIIHGYIVFLETDIEPINLEVLEPTCCGDNGDGNMELPYKIFEAIVRCFSNGNEPIMYVHQNTIDPGIVVEGTYGVAGFNQGFQLYSDIGAFENRNACMLYSKVDTDNFYAVDNGEIPHTFNFSSHFALPLLFDDVLTTNCAVHLYVKVYPYIDEGGGGEG